MNGGPVRGESDLPLVRPTPDQLAPDLPVGCKRSELVQTVNGNRALCV